MFIQYIRFDTYKLFCWFLKLIPTYQWHRINPSEDSVDSDMTQLAPIWLIGLRIDSVDSDQSQFCVNWPILEWLSQ